MKYSVVVPLFNEQDSVPGLYQQLRRVLEATADDFELVFVDDGSTDGTLGILERLAAQDPRTTIVQLRRNYGRTEALVAGFDQATGDCIITMDGDLQHDPNDIPLFLQKIDEGYDIVCGRRMTRPGESFFLRRLPSRVANWMMARLSGVDIRDFGSGFKAYRAEVIRKVPLYGELQRFIPALASAYGARICEVPIRLSQRPYGKSHYGISRAIPVFFDLITVRFLLQYLSRPMHFFGSLGFVSLFLGLSIGAWLAVAKFLRGVHLMSQHGPLVIFAVALTLAGLQLICLGLLGELHVRNYHEREDIRRNSQILRVRKTE